MLPPLVLEQAIEKTVREEWGRILASLVGNLGDFQLAEDCLQDATISAMSQWQKNGLPRAPAAWLITVARRKALDRLRRDQNFASRQKEISYLLDLENQPLDETMTESIPDKRLEMIFTCCHPALEEKSRVALTLRTLGGLSTEEIAAAFLDKPDAMQQRITRAKKKIAATGIPYSVPDSTDLSERMASVLRVVYFIFNEGYSATKGESLTRSELSGEAIRLGRIISELLPADTEVAGLLALMLLHDSRRQTRIGEHGEMIPLEDQNRVRWEKDKISEGVSILEEVLPLNRIGPYQLQAAISAVHAQSRSWSQTNWQEITMLYDLLHAIQPSPTIRLNQAIAVSYASSPQEALTMMIDPATADELGNYQPYHAAMGDVLARCGRKDDAKTHFQKAIGLSDNERERAFLSEKAQQLSSG